MTNLLPVIPVLLISYMRDSMFLKLRGINFFTGFRRLILGLKNVVNARPLHSFTCSDIVLMCAVYMVGTEIKGKRWLLMAVSVGG